MPVRVTIRMIENGHLIRETVGKEVEVHGNATGIRRGNKTRETGWSVYTDGTEILLRRGEQHYKNTESIKVDAATVSGPVTETTFSHDTEAPNK